MDVWWLVSFRIVNQKRKQQKILHFQTLQTRNIPSFKPKTIFGNTAELHDKLEFEAGVEITAVQS